MAINSPVKDTICNVTLYGITLNDSTWTLHGINLKIIDSIVTKTIFVLMSDEKDHKRYLNISRSSFGQIKASRGIVINISNCSIHRNIRLTSTLIDIVKCNLSIENVIFFNQIKYDKGPAIINAVESHICMVNVNISQSYALDGLLRLSNESILHIQNSEFSQNGLFLFTSSVLILKYNSVLILSNFKCDSNGAVFGACVLASGRVTIIAKRATFHGNYAVSGGAVYWKNNIHTSDVLETEDFRRYKAGINISMKKKINFKQEYNSILWFDSCAFSEHIIFEGGVLHLDGSPVDIFVNNCCVKGNFGYTDTGLLFVRGQYPSMAKVYIQVCLFDNNVSFGVSTLTITGAHVDIHNCTIIASGFALMSITDYSIVNITQLSVKETPPPFGYIDVKNSVTLNIADSQMTSSFPFGGPNGFFVFARNNCSVSISNSVFSDGNQNWIMTNVFGISNFSSLAVRNCSFEKSDHGYLNLLIVSLNSRVLFTNCSIVKISGLTVAHNSELQIENSYIVKSTKTWQANGLIEISDNSHMGMTNSSIINNTLQSKKLIFITSNSSLTLSNCLYGTNNLTSHMLSSGGNITIINTRFVRNSVIRTIAGPQGILVVNGARFVLIHTLFDKNGIWGNTASLLTIHADTVVIQKCNISFNFFEIPKFSLSYKISFITIVSSRSISVADTILRNNSIHESYKLTGRFEAIFRIVATNRIPGSYIEIDNCTFGRHDMIYAYIQKISRVLIHQSSFYLSYGDDDHPDGFYFTGLKSLRLWDNVFCNRRKIHDLHFEYDFSYPKDIKVLTLNTSFILRKTALGTSDVNFLQKAEKKGIIDTSFFVKLYHEETQYAAS